MRFLKDSDGTLDYNVDWSEWLLSDTISTVTWTVPTGLTKASQSNTTTVATVWISGGSVGTEYEIGCRITTAGGRIDERTFTIQVVAR